VGVIPISLPYNVMSLIFRADKFSSAGQDQTSVANSFRAALMTQTLCDYQNLPCPNATKRNPSAGTALILPEIAFATPFKTAADALATQNPIAFLKQLQIAVTSANTPPKSAYEQGLSNQFNVLFGNGNFGKNSDFATATQAAHTAIVDNYTSHLGPNNWIHFTNIGNWGKNVLDRSSITEFIQFGNDITTAAYYHTFKDCFGAPLDQCGRLRPDVSIRAAAAGRALLVPDRIHPAVDRTDRQPREQIRGRQLHARAAIQHGRLAHDRHGHEAAAGRADGQLASDFEPAFQHHASDLRSASGRRHRQRYLCPARNCQAWGYVFSDLSHSARLDSMCPVAGWSPVAGNFFESCIRACVRRENRGGASSAIRCSFRRRRIRRSRGHIPRREARRTRSPMRPILLHGKRCSSQQWRPAIVQVYSGGSSARHKGKRHDAAGHVDIGSQPGFVGRFG
jgi:hypothetical protein